MTEVPNQPVSDIQQQPKTAKDYLGYAPEIFEQSEAATTATEPNVTEQINSILKEVKVDENGKFTYPAGISQELKAAIAATKSFRDTQSSYTKSQQEKKILNAENEALREQIARYETPTSGLTQQERAALEELKFTNPNVWFGKMRELENTAGSRVEAKLNEVTEQARTVTVQQLRRDELDEYNTNNKAQLTIDQLDNDVPIRWKQEVESGKLSFSEFLTRAATLIHGNKVVVNPEVGTGTSLTSIAGGTKDPAPTNRGIDYAKVTF